MIDPANITKFDRTIPELQEFLIFCILVAGRRASHIASVQEKLTKEFERLLSPIYPPLFLFGSWNENSLSMFLRRAGVGCYTVKARGLIAAYERFYCCFDRPGLRDCPVEDLEALPGVGMKTARFFVLHSRESARVACLDTHILRWMKKQGVRSVPKQSPSSRLVYRRLERSFLRMARRRGVTPQELDLKIWKEGSGCSSIERS